MGFGTLFAGYFLILNIAYYGFSDFLAAAIMLYGLYKLSSVNQGFKAAMYSMCLFGVFSLVELVAFTLDMFSIGGNLAAFMTVLSTLRHLLVCLFTVPMLIGMRDVCREVELPDLAVRCKRSIFAAFAVYALGIVLEAEGIFSFIPANYLPLVSLAMMTLTLIYVIFNLTNIYSCYMKICMPGEDEKRKEKKSGIMDKFMARQEEKQREYIEYKLENKAKKDEKRKKK